MLTKSLFIEVKECILSINEYTNVKANELKLFFELNYL